MPEIDGLSGPISYGESTPMTMASFPVFGYTQEQVSPDFFGSLKSSGLAGAFNTALNGYLDIEKYKTMAKIEASKSPQTTIDSQTPQNASPAGQQANALVIPQGLILVLMISGAFLLLKDD
jgi:hypothetical protein